jgi:transposase
VEVRVRRVTQAVLPLLPADAVPIGPLAGLVEGPDGGGVFVAGLATFAFDAGDEVGRRLAAVQLVTTKIASAVAVAEGFGVTEVTLWRWRRSFDEDGVAGLIGAKTGPKGPHKLTEQVIARARELDGRGWTLAAIAARVGVSVSTVRVALGRVGGVGLQESDEACAPRGHEAGSHAAVQGQGGGARAGRGVDDGAGLAVLPMPVPRTGERAAARVGELMEAPVVFTEGAHLPLAGLLLILPALAATGLLAAFEQTFPRLRNGFYGLRATVMMLLFLALLRDPRAEGATRIRPVDLGRLLGLDRAPEVKTLRRKLTELAGNQRAAALQTALAAAHARARPEALGFLHIDGHTRVYSGTRDLPKTHVARMHLAAHASAETWIADADADPVMVVTAVPGASLAGELVRLLPQLRELVGPDRRATVIFDRGGWSPATFATLISAGFDILTYRKGPFDRLPTSAFTTQTHTEPDGDARTYTLAETTVALPLPGGRALSLRQIHRLGADGAQIPVLTSRLDLPAAAVCWRLSARWRQENYFKYAREHFSLDGLDSYAAIADDPDRPVPNPAKKRRRAGVENARAALNGAENALSSAIDEAATRAGQPGAGGSAEVDPAAIDALNHARQRLDQALTASRDTPTHLPLGQVRPNAALIDEETKLITHAIRMAAYNAESTLARMIRPHYARAEDEARALLREAMTLSGDLQINGQTLHLRLDPASAPRRSRALAALCAQLTATETLYPGTQLKIAYCVKGHPSDAHTDPAVMGGVSLGAPGSARQARPDMID